jgi:hypothetical protein
MAILSELQESKYFRSGAISTVRMTPIRNEKIGLTPGPDTWPLTPGPPGHLAIGLTPGHVYLYYANVMREAEWNKTLPDSAGVVTIASMHL